MRIWLGVVWLGKHRRVPISLPQGLGLILKGIGWGFGACVDHRKSLIVFYQHKLHLGPTSFDRTGLNIASHAQAFV